MKKIMPAVGDIIDARCPKCIKVTNHLIVAILDSKPLDVQCNTCNGSHRYRQPAALPKTVQPTSGSSLVKEEEWTELRKAVSNVLAKDYVMDREYRVGAVIKHPSFGLGLVKRVVGSRKMEVLFDDGKKMMRCK